MTKSKPCSVCGEPIAPDRLEALPDTPYCIACASSHVAQRVAFMDYSHKTAPSLVIVEGNDRESLRLANRAYRRAR